MVHRSSSCPNLTFEREESPQVARRRAMSEVQPYGPFALQRVQSDSDLLAIDRTRTFATGSLVQPSELLARVVDALGTMQNEENNCFEDGFHGFSDEEILASENRGSGWSLGGEKLFAQPPPIPRPRAVSEIRVPVTLQEDGYSNGDWTWSGPAAAEKVKELRKLRRNGKLSVPNVSSFSRQSESSASDISNAPKAIFSKLNPFKKQAPKRLEVEKNRIMPPETDSMTPAEYLRKTARGRTSMAPPMSSHQRYLNTTRGGRASRISLPSQSADVLEQTTIADLIRALETLHTGSSSPPRRKYGTASMTPPRDPPPLLRLFPPSSPQPRRMSVYQTGGRRMSVAPAAALPPPLTRRRLSLHPSSATRPGFTPTLAPLVSGSVTPARTLGLQPPPYSALEHPRRRPPRRQSMWGPAISHPPSPLPGRTRCESLTEVKIDDLKK